VIASFPPSPYSFYIEKIDLLSGILASTDKNVIHSTFLNSFKMAVCPSEDYWRPLVYI